MTGAIHRWLPCTFGFELAKRTEFGITHGYQATLGQDEGDFGVLRTAVGNPHYHCGRHEDGAFLIVKTRRILNFRQLFAGWNIQAQRRLDEAFLLLVRGKQVDP